jgi:hypothetical protein
MLKKVSSLKIAAARLIRRLSRLTDSAFRACRNIGRLYGIPTE